MKTVSVRSLEVELGIENSHGLGLHTDLISAYRLT
jgi:hypothetical protein